MLEEYKGLLSNSNDLALICNDQGIVLYTNDSFEKFTNHKVDSILGKPFAPLFDDDNLIKAMDVYKRTLGGESPQYELTFKDSGVICEFKNIPFRDESQNVIGVMGIGRDITERKKKQSILSAHKSRIEAINHVGAMACSSLKLDAVLKLILKGALMAADATVGMIFLKDKDADSLSWGASIGLSDQFVDEYRQKQIILGEGLTGRIAQDGKPIYISENASNDPRVERSVIRSEGFNSYIGVPIYSADNIVGVMNLLTRSPDKFSDDIILLTSAIGLNVGSAIKNAQLYGERIKAEDTCRKESYLRNVLLNNLPCIALIIKKHTREIVACNEVARKLGAAVGKTCFESAAKRNFPCPFCKAEDVWKDTKKREFEAESQGRFWKGFWIPLTDDLYVHYIFDITERKMAEKELTESETRYKSLFENMLNGFALHEIIVDDSNKPVDYVFVEVNERFKLFTGLERENVIGKRVTEVVPDIRGDGFDWIGKYGKVALEGGTLKFEKYNEQLGRHYSISAYSPKKGFFAIVFDDITKRKESEKELQEREQQFRTMFESNPHPMWVYDIETLRFLDVNKSAVAHYGYTRDEFLSMTIMDIRPQKDIPALLENVEKVTTGLDNVEDSWRHVKKDGTLIYVEITSHTIGFDGRQAEVVLSNDVTERKNMELTILAIEDKERKRIGYELHDDLGQILTGISFKIHGLAGLLEEKAQMTESEKAYEIAALINEAQIRISQISQGFSPVIIGSRGLINALESLSAYTIKTFNIQCRVISSGFFTISKNAVNQLYRIVHEAVNNAVKHSEADRIEIRLYTIKGILYVTVSDNGIGIQPSSERSNGMGLKIMKYRSGIINASFNISPGKKGGTTVTCAITVLSETL